LDNGTYKDKDFAPVPVDANKSDGPKTPKKPLDDFRGGFDPKTVQIKDTGSLAFLILHELSHSKTILGDDFSKCNTLPSHSTYIHFQLGVLRSQTLTLIAEDSLLAADQGGRLWSQVKKAGSSADASKQSDKYGPYVPIKNASEYQSNHTVANG
jgi:hypothetical protein